MALSYDPKDAVTVLPEGEYNVVLEKYEEKVSSKGNDMMVLTWKAFPSDNRPPALVTDYIVFPALTFKLKKLAKAMGRMNDFEARTFQPEDYIGTSVKAFLKIDQQEGFDDKNAIGNYLPAAEGSAPAGKFAPATDKDKDIPF